MDSEAVQEFTQHVDDFRRSYLTRAMALLAATVWAVSMGVYLATRTGTVVGMLAGFEALCWLSYQLCRRNLLFLARHLFVAGLVAWLMALLWIVRDPAILFLPVLAAPVFLAVLEPRAASLYAVLIPIGQLVSARLLFPGAWPAWQLWLAPGLTLLGMALALIWNINLANVLAWALHSTRSAVQRLEAVQEHRAQLHKSMEQLDAACQRLERANEMLVAARAEAEAARQARNQFALTVSHELRTPLSFIIGFSELMVNVPGTYGDLERWPAGLYEDIREIYHSSNHLLRLVNDILELGQAEAQRMILIKEWVNPVQIALETEAIMRAAVTAQALSLEVEIEPGVPDLYVDRTRIRQVLINLVGNSLRFTEKGGIRLSVRRRQEDVLFEVQDSGSGISPEEVSKVFEKFGQANATVWRRRGGSGLGVPISQSFVEMHGGRMWLESEVGKGTRFYFTLPLPGTYPQLSEAPDAGADDYWRAMAEQGRAPKLLVVLSHDPNAGDLIAACMEDYRVVDVRHPDAARVQINNLLPAALIVDQAMAGEPEVQTLVQNLPYDLPVLVFRLPGSSVHSRELPAGIARYLVKPVLREELVAAILSLAAGVRTLLVIDDDPAMARFVTLSLAAAQDGAGAPREGIRLVSATTGQAALACIQQTGGEELPDAVLLDLSLPDMSGWDILAALQQATGWRNVPVILVTAANLPEEMDSRERKVLQISTSRPLAAEELSQALTALLSAIRPRFPASAETPDRPAGAPG